MIFISKATITKILHFALTNSFYSNTDSVEWDPQKVAHVFLIYQQNTYLSILHFHIKKIIFHEFHWGKKKSFNNFFLNFIYIIQNLVINI